MAEQRTYNSLQENDASGRFKRHDMTMPLPYAASLQNLTLPHTNRVALSFSLPSVLQEADSFPRLGDC